MDPLPNPAPLASKLRNTLLRYHSIGAGEWRGAKKTVSALGGFPVRSPREAVGYPCGGKRPLYRITRLRNTRVGWGPAGLQTGRRCETIPLERL